MKIATRIAIALATALTAVQARAQTIMFNFDNVPAHSGLPVNVTVSGLTAFLSGSGYGYSIQQANVLGFTPAGFSGNCIYPDSIYPADLNISFSMDISDFSMKYSPEEYGCDSSATMRITAYEDGVKVGSTTTTAPNPGTWPTGTLTFNNGKAFDQVIIHYDRPPVTGGDWGPIFMADNMKVTVSKIPDATNDAYDCAINTLLNVNAADGVMSNDENVTGAKAVLVTQPLHGTLSLAVDGSFSYTPSANYVGPDSFTYKDVTATASSNVATVKLNVLPNLTSLTISPNGLLSGGSTKGTVTISTPAPSTGTTIQLSSTLVNLPAPATVKVGAGKTSATFTLYATSVSTAASGEIRATLGAISLAKTVTVYPRSKLVGISATPKTVVGGAKPKFTVTLDKPVPVGYQVVTLSSGNTAATVPLSVKVMAGKSTAVFNAVTTPVDANTTVAVSASMDAVKLTETLTITPPAVLKVVLVPSTLVGGATSQATIYLNGAAGPSGVVLSLTSSNAAATVTGSVTIPAGSTSVTVPVNTRSVMATTLAKISASYGGSMRTATLTITP